MGVIWSIFLIWWYKKGSVKKQQQQQITILTFNLSRTRKQVIFVSIEKGHF